PTLPSLFPSGGGSRSVLSAGYRDGPPAACKVARAAGSHEHELLVAEPEQATRSPAAAGRDLRLVHRGLRHRRPPGGQGPAHSTRMNQRQITVPDATELPVQECVMSRRRAKATIPMRRMRLPPRAEGG